MSLPRREGVGPTDRLEAGRQPDLVTARFSSAAGLVELAADYRFFTHDLLFIVAGLDRDPLADYSAGYGGDKPAVLPFVLNLPSPWFLTASADPAVAEMTCRMYAVRKDGWPAVEKFLSAIAVVRLADRSYFQVAVQEIAVHDVLAASNLSVLPEPFPTVPVVVFGVDSNRGLYGLLPSARPSPLFLASLARMEARVETIARAERFLSADPSPLNERSAEEEFRELADGLANTAKERKEPMP